jgi:choline kinase
MKAVIWSAGRGSRLGANESPKPLYGLGVGGAGPSFLERQVACLRRAGIADVMVIVGWRKERIYEALTGQVRFIENRHPTITESGTSHSLQFAALSAFNPFDGTEPVLLLDGDLVYEQRLLSTVLDTATRTSIVVSPITAADSEEVRVYGSPSQPCLIGKGLAPPITDGLELLGEFTGIWRIEPAEHELVRGLLTWLVGIPGASRPFGFSKIASEHEELAQYMMTLKRLAVVVLPADILFAEGDTPEDLDRIRTELYPAVVARDANN